MLVPFATALVFVLSIFAVSCKKGGPAKPYDAPLADQSGNMMVEVVLGGKIQAGTTINIVDPLNQVFQGITDVTGTCSFNFDFKKTSVDQASPVFSIQLPAQNHYAATTCAYTAHDGPNTFIFNNSGTMTAAPPTSAPTSYAYNITNNLVYTCTYDKGGNAEVPVSIVAQNVPSSWTVNYQNQILGGSVTQSAITFVIPANEYRQPPVSIWGYYANGSSSGYYVCSQPFAFTRGYPVSFCAYVSLSFEKASAYAGQSFIALSAASFNFSTVNGVNIPLQGRLQVFGYVGGGTSTWAKVEDFWADGNGSGSNSVNPGGNGPVMSLNTNLSIQIDIVPPAGSGLSQCTFTNSSFPTGGSGTSTFSYAYDLPCQQASSN